MRKLQLSTAIVLLLLASATAALWARSAKQPVTSFTPPPQVGMIYTVINFPRAGGRAQHALVSVDLGDDHRDLVVPSPYTSNPCSTTTPSGFVLRTRHNQPESEPFQLVTNGTVVRGPYQGDVPLELLSACYKLVK
ncbi:MAG TPA: hypothetical protein VF173_35665 [Thermoanaerobaculia bacterium]|nr:hypothetical protein [Thermoanaerobaculia bacterium]